MKNKRLIGFIMRVVGTMALGLISGWTIRDFGTKALWYVIGIVAMTTSVLVGAYLEGN